MFDPTTDHLVPVRKCRPYFPSAYRKGSVSDRTLRRWMDHGRNGVLLRSVKVGGIRYTSIEAIREFVRESARRGASSEADEPQSCPIPNRGNGEPLDSTGDGRRDRRPKSGGRSTVELNARGFGPRNAGGVAAKSGGTPIAGRTPPRRPPLTDGQHD